MTEEQDLVGTIHYYKDMYSSWSHVLSHLVREAIGPEGRSIIWKNLEMTIQELNQMVSDETLLKYPD